MSPHGVEESNSDSQQRWEDDGGVIPLDRSSPAIRAVLALGKWKAAKGGFVYTKATHQARTGLVDIWPIASGDL
jgi:hypothetical protein